MASVIDRFAQLLQRRARTVPDYPVRSYLAAVDSTRAEEIKKRTGGRLNPRPSITQLGYYQSDADDAERRAAQGDLSLAAKILKSCHRDGVYSGLLDSLSSGLLSCKLEYHGDQQICDALESGHISGSANRDPRSLLSVMCPPGELSCVVTDLQEFCLSVCELLYTDARDYPLLVHRDLEYVRYDYQSNRFLFQTEQGLTEISPGDGHWVVFCSARDQPWARGAWRAAARTVLRKEVCELYADAFAAKHAHPIRIASVPSGADEAAAWAMVEQMIAWGPDAVAALPSGWDAKLLESSSSGWEIFIKTIASCDEQLKYIVSGETASATGGKAFASAEVPRAIRADKIQALGDVISRTINEQVLPAFIALRYGAQAVETRPVEMGWDTTPPKDLAAEGNALAQAAGAITALNAVYGERLDRVQLATAFKIPLRTPEQMLAAPMQLAPAPVLAPAAPVLQLVPNTPTQPAADSGDTVAPEPVADGEEKPADQALNGAQITSLVGVIQAVAGGTLPRESAIEILQMAFRLERAEAERLLGPVKEGSQPAAAPQPGAAA